MTGLFPDYSFAALARNRSVTATPPLHMTILREHGVWYRRLAEEHNWQNGQTALEAALQFFLAVMSCYDRGVEVRILGWRYLRSLRLEQTPLRLHPEPLAYDHSKPDGYFLYPVSPPRMDAERMTRLEEMFGRLGLQQRLPLSASFRDRSLTAMTFYLETLALVREHKAEVYAMFPPPSAARERIPRRLWKYMPYDHLAVSDIAPSARHRPLSRIRAPDVREELEFYCGPQKLMGP